MVPRRGAWALPFARRLITPAATTRQGYATSSARGRKTGNHLCWSLVFCLARDRTQNRKPLLL